MQTHNRTVSKPFHVERLKGVPTERQKRANHIEKEKGKHNGVRRNYSYDHYYYKHYDRIKHFVKAKRNELSGKKKTYKKPEELCAR